MRIAHVTDFYLPRLGGIELHVSDLATRQLAAGHEVTVVTASPSHGAAEPLGADVVRVTDAYRRPHVLDPRAPFAGARVLLDEGFDVVHVHVAIASPLAFWAARTCAQAGLPTVVTVHSLWGWAHPILRTLDTLGGYSRRPLRW